MREPVAPFFRRLHERQSNDANASARSCLGSGTLPLRRGGRCGALGRERGGRLARTIRRSDERVLFRTAGTLVDGAGTVGHEALQERFGIAETGGATERLPGWPLPER